MFHIIGARVLFPSWRLTQGDLYIPQFLCFTTWLMVAWLLLDVETGFRIFFFEKKNLVVYKTTHNGSIIASIIHYMHAKNWCGTIINKERGECDIILWYRIIARQSRKISDKYILYTYLHWDSIKQ
jgi:hypothetical protein